MVMGGRIVSPVCDNIDAQGTCVLPPMGGFASTSVGRFDYRNIVGFERATSTVSGQKVTHEGITSGDTLVTVAIEGLNILDVITADRVVARMTSTNAERKNGSDPEALPFGSHFENLRIGGVPIELSPYPQLVSEETSTYQKLVRACLRRCDSSECVPFMYSSGAPIDDNEIPEDHFSDVLKTTSDRTLLAPLFNLKEIQSALPAGCTPSGMHGIAIPGFGVAYFGEYLITRASRRLTMLRIELGCPITGRIMCANVDSNGHWDP
ncbi:MAG: hypothetical protein HOP03_04745 [Lysobacter sp.]|nr:hypothetical protein [Lysobacter sp.]